MPPALQTFRFGTIAVLLLLLTACQLPVNTPSTAVTKRTKASSTIKKSTPAPSNAPSPSPLPSTSAAPSAPPSATPTPTPLPSVALILQGTVSIDPRYVLQAGMAERTGSGVKLIGNNSAGLISDKGLGIISNGGGSLIGKTKYTVAQAGGTSALSPVEGILVEAISLLTGEIVAGPVATNAAGEYRLGFIETPASNLRVVAHVANTTEARYAYSSLTQPVTTPIQTNDSSRAVTAHILAVVPARLGPIIEAHKSGNPAAGQAIVDTYPNTAQASLMMKAFNAKLGTVPVADLKTLDQEGKLASGISERMVAFADLSKPPYGKLLELLDEVRVYDRSRATPAEPPLVDQVVTLAHSRENILKIGPLLAAEGMAAGDAQRLGDAIHDASNAVAEDLGVVTLAHQKEVLGPLWDYFPGGLF